MCSFFKSIIAFFKMIYCILSYAVLFSTHIVNILGFLSRFSVFFIHYFFTLLFLLFFASLFIKLKRPNYLSVENMLGKNSLMFPIAYLASLFDYPENSKIAIQKVSFLLESQVIDLNP